MPTSLPGGFNITYGIVNNILPVLRGQFVISWVGPEPPKTHLEYKVLRNAFRKDLQCRTKECRIPIAC